MAIFSKNEDRKLTAEEEDSCLQDERQQKETTREA